MIKAKDLKKLVRYKEGDNNEAIYSDYDIKIALNEALRFFAQSQSLQNSDFLETSVIYDQDEMNNELLASNDEEDVELYDFVNEGIDLPDDFATLAGVTDSYDRDLRPVDITKTPHIHQYKVMGNKIYVGVPRFKLTYKKTITEISNIDEDEIDVPYFCTDVIVKTTCMILNNAETDIMLQQIDNMCKSIVPRRRYNNARIRMPFYC